jgi:transcription termination/antitermination protein NusG
MNWYIIKTFSKKEIQVKDQILKKVEQEKLQDLIKNVQVPVESIISLSKGKKKEKVRPLYSGYVFIQTTYTQKVIDLLKEVSGYLGFVTVNPSNKTPIPLRPHEVASMIEIEESRSQLPTLDVGYKKGDAVAVESGPLKGYEGILSEILQDKVRGVVQLDIFGRKTPTEVNLADLSPL